MMKKKTILVVEDNTLNMKLMRALLRLNNYRVLEAPDAETGIQIARLCRPALILMDLRLPGIDGIRASRILRSDARTQSLPIVAVTSYAMNGDEEKARRAGCVEYVTKPIDTHRFPNLVAEIIQRFAVKDSNQTAFPQNGAGTELRES